MTIQRVFRGFATRKKVKQFKLIVAEFGAHKMEQAIYKIQRQARVFLNVVRFRSGLCKLILLKNIVEAKQIKEKKWLLRAFERMLATDQ